MAIDHIEVRNETIFKGGVYTESRLGELGFWQTSNKGNKILWSNGDYTLITWWGELTYIGQIVKV